MIEIVERRVSEECGCPEEDVICDGIFMTIHHEPDKTGHIIVDWGECGEEDFFTGPCQDIAELEQEAERLAQTLIQTRSLEEWA